MLPNGWENPHYESTHEEHAARYDRVCKPEDLFEGRLCINCGWIRPLLTVGDILRHKVQFAQERRRYQ